MTAQVYKHQDWAGRLTPQNKVFEVLSDPISYELFKIIVSNGGYSKADLITQMNPRPTLKQFYARMQRMKETGIVRSVKAKYLASPYGRIIYKVASGLDEAEKVKPKLLALEITKEALPEPDWKKMCEILITNEQIRRLAFNNENGSANGNEKKE